MKAPPFQRNLRVLTIRQPWASLLAHRMKFNETRSWQTGYRGLVAVHSSSGQPTAEEAALCDKPLFKAALSRISEIPFGAIIAVGTLEAITPTAYFEIDRSSMEYAFGDYQPDRYAWHFTGMRLIDPIDTKGSLGLWTPDLELHERVLVAAGFDRDQGPKPSLNPTNARREIWPARYDPQEVPRLFLTGRMNKRQLKP